jgi:glycosyltransferase involved in cell wall biosynthesis
MELSIIMPCLNEAETLETCIRKANGFLQRSGIDGEVVIGDNGSTDGSQEIARRCGARVVDVPIRGYGAALYAATQAARGKYCIMADSDDSYDLSNLEPFVEKLRQGADLVMGNRFTGEIKQGAMPWKNRYIGNPILSGIGKILFHSKLGDFHCGIRGYSKRAFEMMDLRTTGMEYASEMVIKSTLMKLRMDEVPTTLSPDGRSRPPHLRPYRDGWRHLRFMLLYSPNWLFLYPGLAMILVGLVLGAVLLQGTVQVGGVNLSIDTLIYCAFSVVIGLQAVLFSILSRVYAVHEKLYPRTAGYQFAFKWITLERGLITGTLILLLGLLTGLYAMLQWRQQSFGMMDIERISRIVIPSAAGMTVGFELILFSFLFSTLSMGIRQNTMAALAQFQDAPARPQRAAAAAS